MSRKRKYTKPTRVWYSHGFAYIEYDGKGKRSFHWLRLYRIWLIMKERCSEAPSMLKQKKTAKYYCLRGIKVCEEWQKFVPFRDWALSHGYRDDLTIDRIDSYGDYCPENCRWATYHEQNVKAWIERKKNKDKKTTLKITRMRLLRGGGSGSTLNVSGGTFKTSNLALGTATK